MNATLGFRVKSGWAVAVLLAGSAESPQVLDRRVVQLCDPVGIRPCIHLVTLGWQMAQKLFFFRHFNFMATNDLASVWRPIAMNLIGGAW